VSATPPTNSELDRFRDQADSFIRDLDEEYYLHFAGLKETLDVEQIYERYEELTKLETAQKLKDAPTELWRFACEGFLGNLTREHQARVAKAEAELEATVNGETIPYRMLRVAMSNEPDRDTRKLLEEARLRLLDEHLNPIYLDAVQIDQEAVRRLAAPNDAVPNYYELYKRFGFKLDEVAAECQELLDETERLWEREGEKLFRSRLGIGLDEARPWDVVRLFRAPELDKLYPNDQMLPALEHTLTDLGIDLRSQENVHLDLDTRPSKSPRAFCAPIDVPGKVMLVIQPIGGKDDWEALFHEAGHTEHYANTSGDLPMEARRLGDMAVTEGWAMLMQHLVTEPAWLNRRLDVPRVEELAHDGAVSLLYSCGATPRNCSTKSSSSRRRTSRRCAAGTPRSSATRSSCPSTRRATSTISTAASTSPATSARGRSRRSCASSCAVSSGTTGSRSATQATCCASCGHSARGRPPISSSRT